MNQSNETDKKRKDIYGGLLKYFIMTKQKTLDWKIVGISILAIAAIEIVALLKDIDGALMVLAVGAIAGLAGYVLPSPVKLK